MATHRGGQQVVYNDDDPPGTVVQHTAPDDDTSDHPVSARVVAIADGGNSTSRYASWLVDRYGTEIVRRGETVLTRPVANVLAVDKRTLTMTVERVRETVGPTRSDCRVLAPATLKSCHGRTDDELSDVESQYAALLGRKHPPSTWQETECESA